MIGEYEAGVVARYKAARAAIERGVRKQPKPPTEAPPAQPIPFDPVRPGGVWKREGWKGVVYDVCLDHRVHIADLMVGDKRPAVVEARREIIQRLRYDRHYSLKQICDCLSLHHTSVIYNLRRAEGVPARDLKRWAYRYAEDAA